jgi:hypothetical protein
LASVDLHLNWDSILAITKINGWRRFPERNGKETLVLQVVTFTSHLPSKHGCYPMRTSAITAAALVLSIMSGAVNANDDFSALLADLSFGDAPAVIEPTGESLTVVQEETLQDLMPLPGGLSMPGMLESTPDEQPSAAVAVNQPAPQVALMDPVPATVPMSKIDLDAAFAIQETASVPAQSVGHLMHANECESGACGGYEAEAYCRPRGMVNLPSSTFHQYFRSHPCYTNVWDGYGIYCGPHHKHLHGECDCFKKSGCGACGGHGQCDGCDR